MSNEDECKENDNTVIIAEGAVGKAVDALRTHIKSGTKEAYQSSDAAWIVEFTHDMENAYLSAWMKLDAVDIIATSTTPSTFEIAEEDGIPYGSTPVTDSAALSAELSKHWTLPLHIAAEDDTHPNGWYYIEDAAGQKIGGSYPLHVALAIVEAVNNYWKTECVIDRQKFNQAMKDDKALRQQVAELENDVARYDEQIDRNEASYQSAMDEADRLREALKQVCSDLDSMDILPEGGKLAMVRAMKLYVAQALNPKEAENGRISDEGHDHSDSCADSRDSGDRRPTVADAPHSPAPLSEPLKLGRDPISAIASVNATEIMRRDVEVVAAIAEAKHILGERIKNVLAGQKRMQEQIDSLWERTDIYVDLQEKQRRQIDALNATANRALGMAQAAAEGIGDVRRTIDDLAKNCCDSALSDQERLDLLENAVRMSLEQHKAIQTSMVHWGSGDFERMLAKLRDSKEAK